MKNTVKEIVDLELGKPIREICIIEGFGSVNLIYDVICGSENVIVRINESQNKYLEYQKEEWCINNAAYLNIPSPKIIKIGMRDKFPYMILKKIEGVNGKSTSAEQQLSIWYKLGQYAYLFHKTKRIKVAEVEANEFHPNWRSRLNYNIDQLNKNDSLVQNKTISEAEHKEILNILNQLRGKQFEEGLVHGDLCPRNTIFDNKEISLIDWGTAEINVVPHTEIGIVLMENQLRKKEFSEFLSGLRIKPEEYNLIQEEIKMLNLLYRLDKYRWASQYDIENLAEFSDKVRIALKEIVN